MKTIDDKKIMKLFTGTPSVNRFPNTKSVFLRKRLSSPQKRRLNEIFVKWRSYVKRIPLNRRQGKLDLS